MMRRAWVWAFGPGRFGQALIWTLCGLAAALFAVVVVCALPFVFLVWAAAALWAWVEG